MKACADFTASMLICYRLLTKVHAGMGAGFAITKASHNFGRYENNIQIYGRFL